MKGSLDAGTGKEPEARTTKGPRKVSRLNCEELAQRQARFQTRSCRIITREKEDGGDNNNERKREGRCVKDEGKERVDGVDEKAGLGDGRKARLCFKGTSGC